MAMNQVARGVAQGGYRKRTWATVLAGGLALALIAQFPLDAWADGTQAAHWIQHALLFWSGLMAGSGVLRLYQLGSRSD